MKTGVKKKVNLTINLHKVTRFIYFFFPENVNLNMVDVSRLYMTIIKQRKLPNMTKHMPLSTTVIKFLTIMYYLSFHI